MFPLMFFTLSLAFLGYVYLQMGWVGIVGVTLLCGATCLYRR
jgi:hypothetical protein